MSEHITCECRSDKLAESGHTHEECHIKENNSRSGSEGGGGSHRPTKG